MKNLLLVASLSLLASGFASANSAKENLVSNGGFEQGARDWDLHPQMQLVKQDDQPGSTRLLSQALPAPDDGYIHEDHTSQCIEFGDARLFFLDAEFFYLEYPTKDHAHRLNYTWFDKEGCTGGGQYGGFLEPKKRAGWQTLTEDNVKPALHSRSVLINLTHNRRASARDMSIFHTAYYWLAELFGGDTRQQLSSGYWDNISLVAIDYALAGAEMSAAQESSLARGVNLLRNADFNREHQGWWKENRADWTDSEGNEALGSLRVLRTSTEGSNGSLAFEQCVDIDGAPEFEFGGFFMRDEQSTQTGAGRLRLVWYELPGCKGQSRIADQVDPERIPGWQHLHFASSHAPRGVGSVKFQGIQTIDGPGNFVGYWDDMYLMVK